MEQNQNSQGRLLKFRCFDARTKQFHLWGYDVFAKGVFTSPVNPCFPSQQLFGEIKGREVWEGDEISIVDRRGKLMQGVVEFVDGCFSFKITQATHNCGYNVGQTPILCDFVYYDVEVVGNVLLS